MSGSGWRHARRPRWAALLLAVLTLSLVLAPAAIPVPAAQAAFPRADAASGQADAGTDGSVKTDVKAAAPPSADPEPTAAKSAAQKAARALPQAEETPSVPSEKSTPKADETSAAPSEKPTPKAVETSEAPSETPTPKADEATATPSQERTTTPDEPTPSPSATQGAETSRASASPSPSAAETSASPSPASAPTITSDLADYPPGGTVTLTGTGWQPGEVVTIVVNDTGGLSWNLRQEVLADAEGRITLTFELPPHYVPDYDVTAIGPLSGTATTTFTDATQPYYYWMTQSDPTGGAPNGGTTVTGGRQITYNVYGRRSSSNSVTNAVITLTLTGTSSATFDSTGQPTNVVVSADGKTATWRPSRLARTDVLAAIKATVTSDSPAGSITATVTGDALGSFYDGSPSSRYSYLIHPVTGPVTNSCDFANEGSGPYASAICWFDLTGYDAATAASTNGQTMRQTLLDGRYTLTYTLKATSTRGTGTNVIAKSFPAWYPAGGGGAFLGNPRFSNNYQGVTGAPALYQQTNASTTELRLSKIELTDASNTKVSGFALVGADAESTDGGESITWTSAPNPLVSIGDLGSDPTKACGGTGGLTVSGTTATCPGSTTTGKSGTAILYSQDPSTFTQTMVGGGLQAVAFGVMVSGIQLKKSVVNPVATTDEFRIAVSSGSSELASARANKDSGWAADTGPVYWITSGSSQTFTMSETPTAGTDPDNYATTWTCTNRGKPFTDLVGTSLAKTVTMKFGDIISCEITNTGPSLTLKKSVDNAAGGSLTPADWTLTATGSTATVSKAPVPPWTVSGTLSTGSTTSTAVPVGGYTLSESSTATGAGGYTAGAWTCANSSGTTVPVSSNVVTLAAGNIVTCSITNTYVRAVTLQKTWVNGVSGDKADLIIGGATGSPGRVTSTANGDPGPWTDPVNVARTVPTLGSTVSVAETLASTNRGKYTARLECRDGSDNLITVSSSGTFSMPASNVVCTFTNDGVKPTIAVWKTTTGAFGGPFPFALTNTVPTTGTATTTEAGTPVEVDADATTSGAQPFTIADFEADVTIDEAAASMPPGWVFVQATCTDGTATVGSLDGTKYTIPAASLNAGAAIRCDYTNRPVTGAVTWSKVDAGTTTTTWLKGSVWTLTGPSHPTGVDVADCEAASAEGCALLATPTIDEDPATGRFSVPGLFYGTYTLVEKTAPVGFRLDTTEHTFSIATDGSIVEVGEIGNERVAVPPLPLTGGPSTDSFVIAGALLLALAAAAAWRQRRRVQHPPT